MSLIVIVKSTDDDVLATVLVKDEEEALMLQFELEELGDFITEWYGVETMLSFLQDVKERYAHDSPGTD